MNDMKSYNQRSDGPTVDALELKLTGSTSLDSDLKRTQDVEVTIRGTVVGHAFTDKYDKNGDVAQTVKSATVKVDELVEIIILTVPRRMKGQTAMNVDGGEDNGASVVIYDAAGQPIPVDDGEVVDAEVVGELMPGPRPDGVDENGEVLADDALNPEDEDPPIGEDEEPAPPPAPVERHPQVPESAWTTLNHEQKLDVDQRMARLAAQGTAIAEARNSTDVAAATKHHEATVRALAEDYGIELIPAEEIEGADADIPDDEPPPAPVSVTSPPVSGRELARRRKYLLAKRGLPGEAETARQEELAEIERRLGAQAAPA